MDTSKIIRGVVSNGRYTVTAPIVKEDYGLYLQIEGVELPSSYQVDFSNSENNGTSVTMIGNADGVLIPHQFISTGKDVFAFLYHVGADFGRTVYKFRIPNKVRPDRTNEQPTPEEQSTIDQVIASLNDAVEQTAQDVASADASAQSASEFAEDARDAEARAMARAATAKNHADRAEQARDDAQTYANNAQTSATQASTSASQASASATASANSASASAQIKADVEGMADDAQGYASASAQSATASANSASQASGYAQSASSSAQSASDYASQAQTSANTASAKAQDASQSASTASQKATESAQSATNASQSAQTAEQAKTASQTAQGLAESARDSAVSAKNDAESAKADAESARDEAQQAVASISGALADKAPVITDTASGSIASFSDGADNLPLKSLVVDINPIQDLSQGDPSPTNICPISGWTQINVNHSDADTTNPTTITIQLGQTVYGAKLYPLEGKALINMAMVDLGTLSNWRYNVGGTMAFDTRVALTPLAKSNTKCICSQYKTLDYPNQGNITSSDFCVGINKKDDGTTYTAAYVAGTLVVKDSRYSDVDAFQTAMNGVMLCYELAEPIEIQLSANQINSLYGTNNLWADSGDTEVEYRADTKLYIERLTAPDSADMIADANITSGKYFMVGNNLYKATANIASGASVIVGTNCTRKSLSEALNEINA